MRLTEVKLGPDLGPLDTWGSALGKGEAWTSPALLCAPNSPENPPNSAAPVGSSWLLYPLRCCGGLLSSGGAQATKC